MPDEQLPDEALPAAAADAETVPAAEPCDDSTDAAGPALLGSKTVDVSPADAVPYDTPELGQTQPTGLTNIDLLDDVQLDVKIELGRTNLYIEDVLKLGVGSVVELNKLAGDPVDIYVNERLIARGEVLVLNDNFCVRINDIHCPVPELEGAN